MFLRNIYKLSPADCFMKGKRGISGVIETIVLVLLVLLAVGIVWAVVQGLIVNKTDEITKADTIINMKIKKVEIADTTINVQVERLSGEGEMAGIRFIFGDGENTAFTNNYTSMDIYMTKTFKIQKSEIETDITLANLTEVSIVPLFQDESGEEYLGSNILDTYYLE